MKLPIAKLALLLTCSVVTAANGFALAKDETTKRPEPPATVAEFPPGWFPIAKLDDAPTWSDVRKIEDKIQIYFPPNVKQVKGVFFCYVFHSSDPRAAARLWDFALVTVPWQMEYDIGHNDKRNGRFKLGHPVGSMGYLLKYLEVAAQETGHPELAAAPIVGWFGQNGAGFYDDLFARAPERLLAWSDCWPNRIVNYPQVTAKVPIVYAWEFTGKDQKERDEAKAAAGEAIKDELTPAPNLTCRGNTYGFNHGIYSKYGFFVAYLDRCIKVRLPEAASADGKVALKPVSTQMGWVGDYNSISQWAPIAPAAEAKGMVTPVWLPDEYAAWMWRAYHSAKPDLKIVSPVSEYHGGDRSDCGIGYTPAIAAGKPVKVAAEVKGTYAKVEIRDGNLLLGTLTEAPYEIDGLKFDRGLHALIAVGIAADGQHTSSKPALLAVE